MEPGSEALHGGCGVLPVVPGAVAVQSDCGLRGRCLYSKPSALTCVVQALRSMLYKFKSRATADVIMLEANGRQLLQIMGKSPDPHGIVTVAQIPAAIAALEAAIAADEKRDPAAAGASGRGAEEEERDAERANTVRLHQRAAPLIDMLRRSAAEEADVTW